MSDGRIEIETGLDSSGIESGIKKLGNLATAVGIVKIAEELGQVASAAVNVGSAFEAGMSNVSAISGATGAELDDLTEKAKEMGAKTKFSATESAEAFQYMAMAGWKTSDMLEGIEGIMNLAAASGEDLASVSDIVTDALTAFGMQASDSAHFADILAKASSNSNTNVAMMGETFKYVAPVAGALGYSAEDAATAIGLMANAGIKGSQAGTALRAVLSRLSSPTDEVQAAMDALGVSLTDSEGNMKSLGTVMDDLRTGFSNLSEAESTQMAAALGGQEAMSGLLAIVNASESDYKKLSEAIYNADGAAESMAETMQDNLSGKMTILKSALEGLGIQVYESMEAPLKSAAEAGTESIERISGAFASGGIKEAAKETADIFNELTDEVADSNNAFAGIVRPIKSVAKAGLELGGTVLPPLASAIETVAEHTDDLIPLLGGGAAAFEGMKIIDRVTKWYKNASKASKAYAVAMAAEGVVADANSSAHILLASTMSASELVIGVFTGAVEFSTVAEVAMAAATELLNKALNALPFIAVAGAIGTMVASVIATNEKYAQYETVTVSLTKKQEALIEKTGELDEAYQSANEAREEAIQSTVAEYGHYDSLVSELKNITDENGRIKEGCQDRAKVIAGELSSALGTEITMTDGVIDNYKDMISTIDQVIQKQKAEAVAASLQEDIAEAYTQSSEALENYTRLQKESESAADEVKKAQEEYNAALEKYENSAGAADGRQEELLESLASSEQALNNAKAKQEELNSETDKAKTVLEGYQKQISDYNTIAEALASGDAAQIETALQQITSGYKEYTQETLAESEEAREAMFDQASTAVESLKTIQSGAVSVGDELTESTANTAAQAVGEFSKMPGGISAAIEQIGPEASGSMIAALAKADLDGLLNDESKASLDSFINGFEGLDEETQEVWSQAWYGALEGLEGFEDLKDPAEEGTDAFLESLIDALDVHSPSRAVEAIFSQVWPGAEKGLSSGQDSVIEEGNSVITNLLTAMQDGGLLDGAKSVGIKLMNYFGIGLDDKEDDSKKSGKANADAANKGAGSVNPTKTGNKFGTTLGKGITAMSETLRSAGKAISSIANVGSGSVDPTKTGNKFGTMLGGGVSAMARALHDAGSTIANSADRGAGSVDPTKTGSSFSSKYSGGVASVGLYDTGRKRADEANKGIGSVSAYSAGYNFSQGFGNGASGYDLYTIAYRVGTNALDAIKKALKIKSPSREAMKIGAFLGEGLAIGIEDSEKEVYSASDLLSNAALEGLDVKGLADKARAVVSFENAKLGKAISASMEYKIIGKIDAENKQKANDLDALADKIVEGFEKANFEFKVGQRSFARLVRGVQ